MAYSNGCNCSGNCGSVYGNGCARRNNSTWYRNSYAALNTVPTCTRERNYPFYTGNCPNACGCYQCGCTAGVTNQNNGCGCGKNNNCCNRNCDCCDLCNCRDNCGGCGTYAADYCGNSCENCGCDNNCGGCCCDGGGCSECGHCHEHCHDHCRRPVYGLFSANIPLAVTSGAAIPLTANTTSCNDFTVSNGSVTINRCGTYLATYTINIPAGAEIDTSIVMNVNGIAQSSTLMNITAVGSYTGQTVFKVNAGTTVSLVSNAAFSIADPIGQNAVSLTLTRID